MAIRVVRNAHTIKVISTYSTSWKERSIYLQYRPIGQIIQDYTTKLQPATRHHWSAIQYLKMSSLEKIVRHWFSNVAREIYTLNGLYPEEVSASFALMISLEIDFKSHSPGTTYTSVFCIAKQRAFIITVGKMFLKSNIGTCCHRTQLKQKAVIYGICI